VHGTKSALIEAISFCYGPSVGIGIVECPEELQPTGGLEFFETKYPGPPYL